MKYTIKVWLFTILVSPFLLILALEIFINRITWNETTELLFMVIFMILYGLVLSSPAMLLFWVIERKLTNTLTGNKAKVILSAYSFISVWITFYIFDSEFFGRNFQQMIWVVIYSVTIVIGVWIFKLSQPKKTHNSKSTEEIKSESMTTIELTTIVKAPIQIVFDLSRNIDVHQQSAGNSNEKAIEGVTSGLINYNETVTWKGKHFGIYLTHKSRMTAMDFHTYFVDEMEEGKFRFFKHEHFFEEHDGITTMRDKLCYGTPFGIFGRLFDFLFLKKHLTDFILERNTLLRALSEKQQIH